MSSGGTGMATSPGAASSGSRGLVAFNWRGVAFERAEITGSVTRIASGLGGDRRNSG